MQLTSDTEDKGVGILCLDYNEELAAEIEARLTPEQRKANAESAAAAQFVFDAVERYAEEKRKLAEAAGLQPALDEIDAMLAPHLKNELAEENAAARATAKQKADFARFKKCCARWELPSFPAPPQAVAVFLTEESERAPAHVARLCKSVSAVHRAVGFNDPTSDILVRSVVRCIRADKANLKPKKENEK